MIQQRFSKNSTSPWDACIPGGGGVF